MQQDESLALPHAAPSLTVSDGTDGSWRHAGAGGNVSLFGNGDARRFAS